MKFYIFFYVLVFLACIVIRSHFVLIYIRGNDKKHRVGFTCFAVAGVIILSSIRYMVGYDFANYLGWFRWSTEDLMRAHGGLEIMTHVVFYISGLINKPILAFSFFAIVTYIMFWKVYVRYSVDAGESFLIFFSLFYLMSLSSMRHWLAVAITFYGYKFIREKDLKKYILVCLLAMILVHWMAFISIPAYCIYHMKKKSYYIFVLLFFSSYFIYEPIMRFTGEHFYSVYYNMRNSSGNITRLFFLIYFIIAVFIYKQYGLSKNDGGSLMGLLKVTNIGVLSMFLFGGLTGTRIGSFYLIYMTLVVPYCFSRIKNRWIMYLPMSIFFLGYVHVAEEAYIPFQVWNL